MFPVRGGTMFSVTVRALFPTKLGRPTDSGGEERNEEVREREREEVGGWWWRGRKV